MYINLTFFFQLGNVAATILLLRKILWPALLGVISQEDRATEEHARTENELQNAIAALKRHQHEQEITLAHNIQEALEDLAPFEQHLYAPELPQSNPSVELSQERKKALSKASHTLADNLKQRF